MWGRDVALDGPREGTSEVTRDGPMGAALAGPYHTL